MTFQNESGNSYVYDENLFNRLRLLRLKIARVEFIKFITLLTCIIWMI